MGGSGMTPPAPAATGGGGGGLLDSLADNAKDKAQDIGGAAFGHREHGSDDQ
jgi:hypothetical protein